MKKEKIKVYLYTRVSTTMQIDGYSLDAQKTKMKAFCDYNEYEIAGEYEDAGKSGKSIEGRVSFDQMMEDIKSGKDRLYIIRGKRVMLDADLAEIYGYTTKRLNEQVKRNISKFPEDFMF